MRSRGRRLALAAVIASLLAPASAQARAAQDEEAAVRLAIVTAVRARVGAAAAVRLEAVRIDCACDEVAAAGLVALPEPGSRLGRPMRFALTVPGTAPSRPSTRRVGQAVAEVHVSVEHPRAARPITRGATLAAGDVETVLDEIGVAPLAPPPVPADAIGGQAVRNIAPGEVLLPSLVRPALLVRSGQTVRVIARVGRVVAEGSAVAQQSGGRHARIKLVNPESRRTLEGRVIGAGEVEVIHVQ